MMSYPRKFRSQTYDNMDRRKSRGGKSQRREEQKREGQRRERVRGKKMQVCEKVAKSRNTVFFPMICGSRGSKSRLAKAAGAEPCGQMRDEKVARSCGAQHVCKWKSEKNFMFGALLEVEMSKKRTPLWREAHPQVKTYKTHQRRNTFGSWGVEKSARCCGTKHISKPKVQKNEGYGALLDVQMSFCEVGATSSAPCQKWAKNVRVL